MKLVRRLLWAYLVVCFFMWAFQRHIMYHPDKEVLEPAAYGLTGFQSFTLADTDGTHINAWYHKARDGFPTIVYFHGNGGNISGRSHYFYLLAKEGFGLLAIDYRGYGKSEGSPSEEGFYLDARAAVDYCRNQLGLQPARMIVYGESIGTGVAVQMATEYPFAGIVLQSPYTSLLALGQQDYPWLPVSLLEIDRFDSLSKIGRITIPLLLFHGDKDAIVPVAHGHELLQRTTAPSQAMFFPDKGHVDLDIHVMSEAILNFSKKYNFISN